jgi:putative intracellular protease/amidase
MALLVFVISICAAGVILLDAGLTWLEREDTAWAATVAGQKDEEARGCE